MGKNFKKVFGILFISLVVSLPVFIVNLFGAGCATACSDYNNANNYCKHADLQKLISQGGTCPECKLGGLCFYSLNNNHFSFVQNSDLTKAFLQTSDFTGMDLSAVKFIESKAQGTVFKNVRFNGSDMTDAEFNDADFTGATMNSLNLSGTKMMRTVFKDAKIFGCHGEGTNFENADFTNAFFDSTEAKREKGLRNAKFERAKLPGVKINKYYLYKANFKRATFTNGEINESLLEDADFSGANLSDTKILFCRAGDVKFNNANLRNVDFGGTSLFGADFSGANLRGAFFNGAIIKDPSGRIRISFEGADLRGAYFETYELPETSSNKTPKIFKNADVANAKFASKYKNYLKGQGVKNYDKIDWKN
ncbi:MAG TPA: hypothetical protein DHW82_05405 [Spirochaetia bacterium]|nr:MAG: hypothetical protein A2Y41_09095 [Spirochaetes bacterium GWB1_36_13]HCL56429.1 hypothetical protein [Spirochaetia bacterium]